MTQTRILDTDASSMRLKHLRQGWLFLAVFAAAGLVLEVMHGFKVAWYLDVDNETRHSMLRLGHAHGTFLALVNIAFAVTISEKLLDIEAWNSPSRLLSVSTILLPGGFILGGLFPYEGDPGLGILLVPVGAVCLITASVKAYLNLRNEPT